jgi:hypothetical protein
MFLALSIKLIENIKTPKLYLEISSNSKKLSIRFLKAILEIVSINIAS